MKQGIRIDAVIFEDPVKYDPWVKALLVLPIVLLVVFAILLQVDANHRDIFPKEPARDSRTGSIVLFASTIFVLAVYWLVLPRKLSVTQEKIILHFRGFRWNIPYGKIRSIKAARGLIGWRGYSFITSYGSQVEILRKYRFKIRVSPTRRDQFLENANRALAEWTRRHGVQNTRID